MMFWVIHAGRRWLKMQKNWVMLIFDAMHATSIAQVYHQRNLFSDFISYIFKSFVIYIYHDSV